MQALISALEAVAQGGKAKPGTEIRIRRQPIYHRLTYGTAGALAFTFFNASKSKFTTNMPGQGQFPANYAYLALSLGFRGEFFGAGTELNDANAIAGADAIEKIRQIYEQGLVSMRLQDRVLIDDVYGLCTFPQGGGADIRGGITTTASTTSAMVGNVTNGSPFDANKFLFGPSGEIIGPNEAFSVNVEYESLITVPVAGKLIAVMDGYLATFSNS